MTKLETRPSDRETREERAEAAEHRGEEREHRREAAADRAEAAADRREGSRLEAAGSELEAKTHDVAAAGHAGAARHDEREAAEAGRAGPRAAATTTVGGTTSTGVTAGRATPPATTAGATPAGTTTAGTPRSTATDGNGHALFGKEQERRFRSRWDEIQSSFIDEPRESVAEADALLREATDALHSLFERDRRQLEGVWDRGDEVSTEDLRVTLQRYRSFFERVLTI